MIEVRDLTFSYTKDKFIEKMNFEVKPGEIFGFLGPSGAGKSTLQKILTGLIRNYEGSVKIDNIECKSAYSAFYEKIGVDFEYSTTYDKLSAKENLEFFSSLYSAQVFSADELLKKVGLYYDADKKISNYSKGMRSRLNFIKALIHNPDILFLDEPTSGLDPVNADIMKKLILEEKKQGKTILLTTHNMADASELCDRVAFIIDGKIMALDTPYNLVMKKGASKVKYAYTAKKEDKTSEVSLDKLYEDKLFLQLLKENRIKSIHTTEPNLNDIFMELTGKELI